MLSSTTIDAVPRLHQLLIGMLPRQWQSATIDVQRDGDGTSYT